MANKDLKVGLKIAVESELLELKQTISELKNAGVNVDKLESQASELTKTMSKLGEQKRAVEAFKALEKQLAETNEELAEMSKREKDVSKGAGGNYTQLVAKKEKLKQKQEELTESIKKTSRTLKRHGIDLDNLGEAEERLAREIGKVDRQFDKLSRKATKKLNLKNQFNEAKESAVGLKVAIVGIGTVIATAFATSKVAAFFTSAVGGAASLEEQLDKVKAVSGATDDEIKKISETAKQLGASTRYTATEAAQGLEILARACLSTQESIQAIPSVLALAQGSSLELAEAAGFITKAVTGMNLSIEDSGRVADVLAKASASANTNVEGLGQALSYAAPSASALGVSLEDTVALIGKFADAGIDASRAGTALNSIFSQFSNPASSFRKELSAIGINTGDVVEALRQLEASGEAGAGAIVAVGQEAGPALKALLSQGTGALDELSAKLQSASGSAQEMAETMDGNLFGSLRGLGSAWESVKNALGEPVLKPITDQIKRLTGVIRDFVAGGEVEKLGDYFAQTFGDMAKSVVDFVQNFTLDDSTNKVNDFASNVIGSFNKVGAAFKLVTSVISVAFNGFKVSVLSVGAVVADVVALIIQGFGEIAGLIPGMEDVEKGLKGVAGGLREVAKEYVESSEDAAGKVVEGLNDIGEASKTLLDDNEKLTQSIKESTNTRKEAIPVVEAYGKGAEETANKIKEKAEAEKENTEAIEKSIIAQKQQSDALKTLGIDLEQVATGMSETELKMIDSIAPALDAINTRFKGTKDEAQLTQKAIVALFENAVQNIKSPEGLAQLDAEFAKLGITVDKTKLDVDVLTKSFSEMTDAIAKATTQQALDAQMNALRQSLSAGKITTEQFAEATQQLVAKRGELIRAESDVAKSTNNTSDKTKEAIRTTQAHAEALVQTAQATQSVADSNKNAELSISLLNNEAAKSPYLLNQVREGLAGMDSETNASARIDAWNRLFNAVQYTSAEYNEHIKVVDALMAKIRSGEASMTDFQQATMFASQGVDYLDAQRLDQLKATIADARAEMDALAESAKNAADAREKELLRLQGKGDEADRLDYLDKIAEIERQIDEARARGNLEAIRQLERQLELERQIYEEKQKKDKQDASPSGSSSSSAASGSSSLAPVVINIGNKPIQTELPAKVASQLGAKMGEFVHKLQYEVSKQVVSETAKAVDDTFKKMADIRHNTIGRH